MAIRRSRNQTSMGPRCHLLILLLVVIESQLNGSLHVSAIISCQPNGPDSNPLQGDALCAEKYRPGSHCVPSSIVATSSTGNSSINTNTGTCSNPFVSGCLRNYLGEDVFRDKRACNSDDGAGAVERGECTESVFDYQEIRILSHNWESAMFSAWIHQIVLSEILGVPTTIETSGPDLHFNFYDPNLAFSYGAVLYDWDALRTASNNVDCQEFQARQTNYTSCAHVMPEAWAGQKEIMIAAEEEGWLEHTLGNGMVSRLSWHVPLFTAVRDPLLLSYIGLSQGDGLDNRRKIAGTFLRPWTWKSFCEDISENNCTSPHYDAEGRLIATRPPADVHEAGKFFLSRSYHGHFAPTDDNDCDKNPKNCTGHFANPECDWTNYCVSQAHHLKIPVKSNGPDVGGGYSYASMVQIYHAANYTKSNVLFYWSTPDPLVQLFLGTDAEFARVLFPASSVECIAARNPVSQRCSANIEDRYGDPAGTCDTVAHVPQKAIVSSLNFYQEEALKSPALEAIKSLRISDLQFEYMFRQWQGRNVDPWNYDARESVCVWVAENLSSLKRSIPDSYPRSKVVQKFDLPASYAARSVGIILVVLVAAVFVFTWVNRKQKVFVYAQPNILFMLIFGLGLVSVGAILYSAIPTDLTCMARQWCVVLGNTLQIVPLAVKVSAINKIFQASLAMQRITIEASKLYKTVGAITGFVAIYLLVWTIVDPMKSQAISELTNVSNINGGQVVQITYSCASRSDVWQIVTWAYIFFLVIFASVLAFQNRHVKQSFNESAYLAFVIYSHLLFSLLRGIIWLLRNKLDSNLVSVFSSFFLSLDVLSTLGIYFLPKVVKVKIGNAPPEGVGVASWSGSDVRRGSNNTVAMIRMSAERRSSIASSVEPAIVNRRVSRRVSMPSITPLQGSFGIRDEEKISVNSERSSNEFERSMLPLDNAESTEMSEPPARRVSFPPLGSLDADKTFGEFERSMPLKDNAESVVMSKRPERIASFPLMIECDLEALDNTKPTTEHDCDLNSDPDDKNKCSIIEPQDLQYGAGDDSSVDVEDGRCYPNAGANTCFNSSGSKSADDEDGTISNNKDVKAKSSTESHSKEATKNTIGGDNIMEESTDSDCK